MRLPESHQRSRQGFGLTDCGTDLIGALDEANYCIECHNQGKDSCSKGLRDRKSGQYQKSPFGVTLAGCPLEEKISEANTVKAAGHPVGALAMIAVDNPLCAATGHRICNDCMKACIYQKQEPVDIPQIGNPHAQGRAGASLGLRDLQPADPLEPAGPAPPHDAG